MTTEWTLPLPHSQLWLSGLQFQYTTCFRNGTFQQHSHILVLRCHWLQHHPFVARPLTSHYVVIKDSLPFFSIMTLGLIPIEICELIIDYVALDLSDTRYEQQYTLRACSCVCRSWVPRTCIHLFKYVELTSAERTRLFHNALRAFPALGRYVQTLEVNGSSSRKTQ